MQTPTPVSLVIPAFNEAACLERNVRAVLDYCRAAAIEGLELIVVDDGSTDGTRAVAEHLAEGDRRIRVVANPMNQGKGAAVRRGMLAATGDPVVFLDADLSAPIETLPKLIAALGAGADVAIASRRVAGAQIATHQPWLRETLGRGFTLLTRVWLHLPIADFTCGMKGFRAAVAKTIFGRQRLDDWSFDAEVCFLANKLGYRIVQVPVVWRDDPDSRVRVSSAVVRSLLGLVRIRWWYHTGRYERGAS